MVTLLFSFFPILSVPSLVLFVLPTTPPGQNLRSVVLTVYSPGRCLTSGFPFHARHTSTCSPIRGRPTG